MNNSLESGTPASAPALEALKALMGPAPQKNGLFFSESACVVYKKNSPVFREGDTAFGVFGVYSGMVKVFKRGLHGHEQIVNVMGPGELMGIRAVLADEPYSATATASETASLYFFPKAVFTNLLKQNPEITYALSVRLCKELGRERENWLSRNDQPALARLARCLLDLQGVFGRAHPSVPADCINFPRQELASMVGVNRDTVSRLLAQLKSKGAIQLRGRAILLRNLATLAHAAEQDPSLRKHVTVREQSAV